MKIEELHIRNFKSIREQNIKFNQINVLIGGNGVGKSNLINFFKLLRNIASKNLKTYTLKNGGAENILHFGRKVSDHLFAWISFRNGNYLNAYSVVLEPDQNNQFVISKEKVLFDRQTNGRSWYDENLSGNGYETGIYLKKTRVAEYVAGAFSDFTIYHFHDTSETAEVKQYSDINDNRKLSENASNLASFLYMLQQRHLDHFNLIEATVQLIAPFFDKFILEPLALNDKQIELEWKEKGTDKYFNANNLSDGTLRMICLITLLLQPNPPDTIIIDEPELGLHPAAITLLAELIKSSSESTQIIVSTQSVTLLNQFRPEDIIVVDRKDGQSVFNRIEEEQFESWSQNYSLGEIWEKNMLGGRP